MACTLVDGPNNSHREQQQHHDVCSLGINNQFPRNKRVEQLREEMGDFGLALFCPLLDLQSVSALKTVPSHHSVATSFDSEEDDDDEGSILRIHEEGDVRSCPRLLTKEQMLQLREHLPYSVRDHVWERRFAIARDGDSFYTLLQYCRGYRYTMVVIRGVHGDTIGGFATAEWSLQSKQYYGSGQSFVFGKDMTVYKWTGRNDYHQICDSEKGILCMGGVGDFGWIVSDDFRYCRTGACQTFGNPPLSDRLIFEIAEFEIYGLKSSWWSLS